MLNYDKIGHSLEEISMILSYGGRNCWSFKEWLEVDFRINKNVPAHYGYKDTGIVSALCFQGANASGKSCALRVLSFIADFCLNSFYYNPDSGIIYDTFFSNNEKSEFYITFTVENKKNVVYTYEVILDNTRVYSEYLYFVNSKDGKKKNYIAKRKDNEFLTDNVSIKYHNIILKGNSSLISTCIQYGIKEYNEIRDFFNGISSNVSYSGTYVDPLDDNAAEFYYKHPDILDNTKALLRRFDTGLSDIKVSKISTLNRKDVYVSTFYHETYDKKQKELSYHSQSTGTKLLYNRLMDFTRSLEVGGVLVYDELDTHLHPSIVPLLLDLFLDEDVNKKGAQIVFTSHNTVVMDILKKYRIYLSKKIDGESFCYRIDEIPDNINIRNDRSLEQTYLSGQIGGVPNVQN